MNIECPKCKSSDVKINQVEVTEQHDAEVETSFNLDCGTVNKIRQEYRGSFCTDELTIICNDCDESTNLISEGCILDDHIDLTEEINKQIDNY